MPRRGNKPREPRLGVYRPGRRPVNIRKVFTSLINNMFMFISILEVELSAAWVFSADFCFPGVASSLTNAGLRRD